MQKAQDTDLRQNLVAELYLRGNSLRAISGILKEKHGLNFSHKTVFFDVQALRQIWKTERLEAYETGLATELEKIDRVEVAAWEGWDRSLKEGNKRTKSKGGEVFEISEYEADGAGDPRFLAIILKCSEQRSRLCGYLKPEEKNQNDAAVPTGQLPASFSEPPTFVVVGGTMDMIEREEDLPDDIDED